MSLEVALAEDHPLVLEFTSLKDAVHHFQSEAHRATIQLQHQSLDHATLLQELHVLENEDSYLRIELQTLRTAGPVGMQRDTLQIQELTLALRRLSDKLDLTEKLLLERNEELIIARSRRDAAKKGEELARETVRRLQAELAACHARSQELMNHVKASEEQRKMSDLVVEEYASLVRSLEGRPSVGSRTNGKGAEERSRNSLDGLMQARQGLHKLLQDSNTDSEKLHAEINHLHDALESARADLEAERAVAQEDRRHLAQAQIELQQMRCDDNTAAKMVARYMKFSQSSTDMLHGAIGNLKGRQEAMVTSYESRLQQTENRIAFERRQSDILRRALDDLTEDISRESYGRRREVVLRLALLAREQMLSERLRRWLLKASEIQQKARSPEDESDLKGTFEKFLEAAKDLLSCIDSPIDPESESVSSAARMFAVHAAAKSLQEELQRETDRRLYFEHQLAASTSQIVKSSISGKKSLDIVAVGPSTTVATGGSGSSSSAVFWDDRRSSTSSLKLHSAASSPDKSDRPRTIGASSSSITVDVSCQTETMDQTSSSALALCASKMESGSARTSVQGHYDDSHSDPSPLEDDGTAAFASPNGASSNAFVSPEAVQADRHSSDNRDSLAKETTGGLVNETKAESLLLGIVADESLSTVRTTKAADPSIMLECSISAQIPAGSCGLPASGSEQLRQCATPRSLVRPPESSPMSPLQPVSLNERYQASHLGQNMEGSDSQQVTELSQQNKTNVAFVLSKLDGADERYTELQRSFRDCHLALQELEQASREAPNSDILLASVERLSDYCEDARVELEIRIADEERISKGFQALLSVPGALSDEVNEQEVMRQVEAFLDGSDPAVRRAQDMLKYKLDDLEHDIASVKCVLHDYASSTLTSYDLHERSALSRMSTWTGSILGHSRTSSPAPSFGAVMTSPRLRHSSSTRSLRSESSNGQSPFASLGLRIPMPSSLPHQPELPPSRMKQRGSNHPSTVFSLGLRGGMTQGIPRSSLAFKYNAISKAVRKDEEDLDSDIE